MIPALESPPDSDFGSFFTTNEGDSGSGSFSLESAPALVPIPVVKIARKLAFFSKMCISCLKIIYFA